MDVGRMYHIYLINNVRYCTKMIEKMKNPKLLLRLFRCVDLRPSIYVIHE